MLRITAPDGAYQLRRIPFDWVQLDTAYTVDVELVADAAVSAGLLWTDRTNWLRADVAGGGLAAVGATRATGLSLGSFTSGQRKTLQLEIKVPALTEIRTDRLPLNLGVGT